MTMAQQSFLLGILVVPGFLVYLLGDRVGLYPVAVIFAIMAGGQLSGFAGILLALPVAAVIMVLPVHLYGNYKDSHQYHASDKS